MSLDFEDQYQRTSSLKADLERIQLMFESNQAFDDQDISWIHQYQKSNDEFLGHLKSIRNDMKEKERVDELKQVLQTRQKIIDQLGKETIVFDEYPELLEMFVDKQLELEEMYVQMKK